MELLWQNGFSPSGKPSTNCRYMLHHKISSLQLIAGEATRADINKHIKDFDIHT